MAGKELRYQARTEAERKLFEGLYQGGRRRRLSAGRAEAVAEDVLGMFREDELLRKAVVEMDQETD